MKTKTRIKAGGISINHNTTARSPAVARGNTVPLVGSAMSRTIGAALARRLWAEERTQRGDAAREPRSPRPEPATRR